ncbi:MAG TPA: hypothetical protein VLT86_05230 [Vicinamibacterales bacterium]|nr:hypothetical protein [Vicinamibacterales bacterium]
MHRLLAWSLVLVGWLAARQSPGAAQSGVPGASMSFSGGTEVMSPSVVGSSVITRDRSGAARLQLVVLWRGSPGWFMRRTGLGGGMSGSSSGRTGVATSSVRLGGLNLTLAFDVATRVARILDEDVPLNDANVILVDQVDDPSGPRVLKTLRVEAALGNSNVLNSLFLSTPELLDYLRCQAQVPDPLNRVPMNYVCSAAVALGKIGAERTVTSIPEGPVQNRAADTAGPLPPRRPIGLSQGASNRLLSPAVVGGWFTHRDGVGATALDLLVLWRGSPGWPLRGDSHDGSSGGGSSGRSGMTVRYGGLVLYALFDGRGRLAQIEDQNIPLNDHNVVLVDDVDSVGGPRVAKTLRIDPALPDPTRIEIAIRRSPELVAYLRCDLKLPDARQQAMMDVVCAQVLGR